MKGPLFQVRMKLFHWQTNNFPFGAHKDKETSVHSNTHCHAFKNECLGWVLKGMKQILKFMRESACLHDSSTKTFSGIEKQLSMLFCGWCQPICHGHVSLGTLLGGETHKRDQSLTRLGVAHPGMVIQNHIWNTCILHKDRLLQISKLLRAFKTDVTYLYIRIPMPKADLKLRFLACVIFKMHFSLWINLSQ